MLLPAYDTEVEVTTKHRGWRLGGPKFELVVTRGKLIRSEDWDPKGTIRVFTGKEHHPVSIIQLDRVVKFLDVNGKLFDMKAPLAPKSKNPQTWSVSGSKGDLYTVTLMEGKWSCSCVGFQYRKHCRHIEDKQKELGAV